MCEFTFGKSLLTDDIFLCIYFYFFGTIGVHLNSRNKTFIRVTHNTRHAINGIHDDADEWHISGGLIESTYS